MPQIVAHNKSKGFYWPYYNTNNKVKQHSFLNTKNNAMITFLFFSQIQ